ncbi:MAG: hypothetical protein WCH60_09550 [Burkholderiales bacterium]
MIFTDANPTFPYQSSEASYELGIPDSPEIHLAITGLAERLIPLAEGASKSDVGIRMTALRTASGAVLFRRPFEMVVLHFRVILDLPFEQDDIDAAAKLAPIDWLGQAVQQLRMEGVEIASDFGKQASHYGWREAP